MHIIERRNELLVAARINKVGFDRESALVTS